MTAAVALRGRSSARRLGRSEVALPPLSPRLQLARASLLCLCVLSTGLLLELVVFSSVQQRADQHRAFDQLRADLAAGTAPVGPTDADGTALALGAAVAYLEIPSISLRQVVVEGTTSSALFRGPGHRRDTPLPGQPGVSVLLGRRAAFGRPFARIHTLRPGDLVRVTTGQGEFDYRVRGVRREGDPVPAAPAAGEGRLLLATADGGPFVPAGVLRVDADLRTAGAAGAAPQFSSRTLPPPEQMMASDPGTLWALALWLQALIAVLLGGIWAWHRWSRAKAWLVFLPPVLITSLLVSGQAARLLPNLL